MDALEITTAAANALVAGFDSPHLRELAGLHSATELAEIRRAAMATFRELGLPFPAEGSEQANAIALNVQCRRYRDGLLTGRQLAGWVLAHCGHDGRREVQELALFSDYFEDLETGAWDGTVEDAKREIDALVDQILGF